MIYDFDNWWAKGDAFLIGRLEKIKLNKKSPFYYDFVVYVNDCDN